MQQALRSVPMLKTPDPPLSVPTPMSTSVGAYAEDPTSTSTGAYAEGPMSTSTGAYAEDPTSTSIGVPRPPLLVPMLKTPCPILRVQQALRSVPTLKQSFHKTLWLMVHQTKTGHKEISSSEDIIKTCFDYLSPVTSTLKIATQLFGRQPRLTLQFMMMHHCTKSGYKGFR